VLADKPEASENLLLSAVIRQRKLTFIGKGAPRSAMPVLN
jgi:hypothetical protein